MASEERGAERWTGDGLYYEYSKAANPIAEGLTTKVPMADFPHHLHEGGPTRVIPFDRGPVGVTLCAGWTTQAPVAPPRSAFARHADRCLFTPSG